MANEVPIAFLRLFVALALPEEVRREIGRTQARLRRNSPPGAVAWTSPDQFHITLKFLGDVPMQQAAGLEQSLAPICGGYPALQLSARGIGFFPNSSQPRVMWVGASDQHGHLQILRRKMDEALLWLGPAERAEKFSAHITLGRFKPGRHAAIPRLLESTQKFRDQDFGGWRAAEVVLVRSELTAARAEHTVMAAFPLAG